LNIDDDIDSITYEEELAVVFDKDDLLNYYKTDSENFSNHILMNICIETFILMINLGSIVKFFYYFLEE
jgi:hypothetical protein